MVLPLLVTNASLTILTNFAGDLRFGLRMLMRSPGLSIISILALAIGMGQAVTMFSIIEGTLFAPLPFRKSEELHTIYWDRPGYWDQNLQWEDFREFRRQQMIFSELAVHQQWPANVVLDQYPESIDMSIMTPNLFQVLGVEPMLGPGVPEDHLLDDEAPVVFISHALWQERLAGATEVIGWAILIEGIFYTITAVMPENFRFPYGETNLWTLQSQNPQATAIDGPVRGAGLHVVIGRIEAPASAAAASEEWNTIAQRLALQFPETNKELTSLSIAPLSEHYAYPGIKRVLWSTQASAILVSIIACLNISMLILANLFRRSGELAVRSSMGASRGRICQQIITEALVISSIGGVGGVILALAGSEFVWKHFAENLWIQNWMHHQLSVKSIFLLCIVVLLTAIAAGLFPAFQVSRANLNSLLTQGDRIGSNRHSERMLRIFSVLQVGISCALFICALFFVDIAYRGMRVPYPYDPDQILVGRALLSKERYPEGPAEVEVLRKIQSELGAIPGVRAVSFTSAVSPAQPKGYWPVGIEGDEYPDMESMPKVYWAQVSLNYFEAIGAPVLRGRDFNPNDHADSPDVALVNTIFANRFWPGGNPIGKRIRSVNPKAGVPNIPWITIIGVAPDMHEEGLDRPGDDGACFYTPSTQGNLGFFTICLHTELGTPASLEKAFRSTLASIDPAFVVRYVRTIGESLKYRYRYMQFMASLFGAFGVFAVILSAAGVFGVFSFAVRNRIREFGVRTALGAPRSAVAFLILRQTAVTLTTGAVLGIVAGFGCLRMLNASHPTGQSDQAAHYLISAAILIITGFAAVIVPTVRAVRLDPVKALRDE